MPNQPIPFKERSTAQGSPAGEPQVQPTPRPPGELGGHTVQPWEQDAVGPTQAPTSKDVPPPEAGAPGAGQAGPGAAGPGKQTTAAPGSTPSQTHGTTTTAAPPLSTNPGGDGSEAQAPRANTPATATPPTPPQAAPSQARPPRPPVHSPQKGHEPAPRPPPTQRPAGPGTEGDQLVEALTRAIAENFAKALHQSVAQAVREAMPLSGRSVDKPAAAGTGAPGNGAKAGSPGRAKLVAETTEAPDPAAQADPAAEPEPAAAPATETGEGEKPSQYGGTIEPPVPTDGSGKPVAP